MFVVVVEGWRSGRGAAQGAGLQRNIHKLPAHLAFPIFECCVCCACMRGIVDVTLTGLQARHVKRGVSDCVSYGVSDFTSAADADGPGG